MAFSHTLTYSFQQNSGAVSQFSYTNTFDGENTAQVAVAALASNFPVAISFDQTKLVDFVMWADAAMTVVFKDSSNATIATYNLAANLPIIWNSNLGANPFSAAVAQALVTSTPGGNLNIYAGLNI